MESALRRLALLTPWRLLLSLWGTALVLSALANVRAMEGVVAAAGLALLAAYPYFLILGLPKGIVRPGIQSLTRWLFVGFVAVLTLTAIFVPLAPKGYSTPMSPRSLREWLEFVGGLAGVATLILPHFLGAAALNDMRRYTREKPVLESIPNFLALYFGLFGGLLYVHRRVREVLYAG